MSEQSTFQISYTSPERVNKTVLIEESVSHIDILLPYPEETFIDGLRWVNTVRKALRIHSIDERSLVLSDLSSLRGDHLTERLVHDAQDGMPFDVMDIEHEEPVAYGREHNPANLDILANPLVSREHFKITPYLGSAGLKLAFVDHRSTNGSGPVEVGRTPVSSFQPYNRLFVA